MTDNKQPASSADREKDILKPEELGNQNELVENAPEVEPSLENKETAELDHQQIRKEIENMPLDDDVKMQAQTHANDLQGVQTQQKIETLLKVAKEKGVVFAVAVAKKMDDPYILDMFHDTLAKEGLYKDFLK